MLIVSFSFQKFVNKCRKLVGLLGCATSSAGVFAPTAPMRSLASSSQAVSSSMAVQDDKEEGYDDEEEDEEEGEEEGEEEEHGEEQEENDEEEEYNDDDGPPSTQTTQLEKRSAPKRDWESPSLVQKTASSSPQEEGG